MGFFKWGSGRAMQVSTRLYLGFGAVLALTLVVAAAALGVMGQVDRQLDRMSKAGVLQEALATAGGALQQYRSLREPHWLVANEDGLQQLSAEVAAAMLLDWSVEENRLLDTLQTQIPQYRQYRDEMNAAWEQRRAIEQSWNRLAVDISSALAELTQRIATAAANYDLRYTLVAYEMAIQMAALEKEFLHLRFDLAELAATGEARLQQLVLERLDTLMQDLAPIVQRLPDFEQAAVHDLQQALAAQREQIAGYLVPVLKEQSTETGLFELSRQMREEVRLLDDTQVGEVRRVVRHAIPLELGVAALALVMGLGVAWAIARRITRPLNDTVALAQAVARGDLAGAGGVVNSDDGEHSRDELGELRRAMMTMREFLVASVSEVRRSAQQISAGAGDIAAGNGNLATRSEQQAAALGETRARMAQLALLVRRNAEHAGQARRQAEVATEVAQGGGAAIDALARSVAGIAASSRKIDEIIGVIESIAFQTNILALNAAVEAARAGSQGRGFAVVAAEVRVLAQRSAAASSDIRALIEESARRVDAGVAEMETTSLTMASIVTVIQRATALMREISAASEEQLHDIEQVDSAVSQMDEVTQRNTVLAAEAAAVAARFETQAGELMQAVARFRVPEEEPLLERSVEVPWELDDADRLLSTTYGPIVKHSGRRAARGECLPI